MSTVVGGCEFDAHTESSLLGNAEGILSFFRALISTSLIVGFFLRIAHGGSPAMIIVAGPAGNVGFLESQVKLLFKPAYVRNATSCLMTIFMFIYMMYTTDLCYKDIIQNIHDFG